MAQLVEVDATSLPVDKKLPHSLPRRARQSHKLHLADHKHCGTLVVASQNPQLSGKHPPRSRQHQLARTALCLACILLAWPISRSLPRYRQTLQHRRQDLVLQIGHQLARQQDPHRQALRPMGQAVRLSVNAEATGSVRASMRPSPPEALHHSLLPTLRKALSSAALLGMRAFLGRRIKRLDHQTRLPLLFLPQWMRLHARACLLAVQTLATIFSSVVTSAMVADQDAMKMIAAMPAIAAVAIRAVSVDRTMSHQDDRHRLAWATVEISEAHTAARKGDQGMTEAVETLPDAKEEAAATTQPTNPAAAACPTQLSPTVPAHHRLHLPAHHHLKTGSATADAAAAVARTTEAGHRDAKTNAEVRREMMAAAEEVMGGREGMMIRRGLIR